jgi:hypothetical protein
MRRRSAARLASSGDRSRASKAALNSVSAINGNLNYTFADPFDNAFGTTGLGGSPSGVIGGAHVGYNYQVNQFVFGLEGTVDGTSVSNTVQAVFPCSAGAGL